VKIDALIERDRGKEASALLLTSVHTRVCGRGVRRSSLSRFCMSFSTVSKIFFETVDNAIIRRQDRICSWATSTQDFNRRVTLPQLISHMVRT
jgi:hypothetical protein